MLPENLVSALLQASITGAGLVLAVYALIIPLARRLFEYRALEIHDSMEELKEKVRKAGTQVSQHELDEMKEVLESIDKRKDFPVYLGVGTAGVFFLYVLSVLMSVWWMVDWNKNAFDLWLPIVFGIATVLFLLIGFYGIGDISSTMKKEFEELKTEYDDTKRKAKHSKI